MAAPADQLHDIADPRPYLPGIQVPLWFWIALVATAGALATILVLSWRRRRRTSLQSPISGCEQYRGALEALRDSLPGRPLADVAVDASFIMRRYLEGFLEEPALFETHEEFLGRKDALAALPQGARDRLLPLFDHLAAAKYSPSQPDPGAGRLLIEACLEALQGVESTRAREVA